jgi:hypothetical protein
MRKYKYGIFVVVVVVVVVVARWDDTTVQECPVFCFFPPCFSSFAELQNQQYFIPSLVHKYYYSMNSTYYSSSHVVICHVLLLIIVSAGIVAASTSRTSDSVGVVSAPRGSSLSTMSDKYAMIKPNNPHYKFPVSFYGQTWYV